MKRMKYLAQALVLVLPLTLQAQWSNQYPLVEGFNHHVYLEGFELPILNAGPMDPAPSPSGNAIAFASRGWLWVLDGASGVARRVTRSPFADARPGWSPDGRQLVFVRDTGRALHIVSVDVASGAERVLVDSDAINLDPVFTPDGAQVYYASAESGQLELWRVAVDSLAREQVTRSAVPKPRPLKRRPLILDPDSLIVFLNKQGSYDSIELLNTRTGTTTTLAEERITAQAGIALSPDGRYLAYVWPFDGGWEIRLLAISAPDSSVLLTQSRGLPLAPAFSPDGAWVYFAEADGQERMELRRVSVNGGAAEAVPVRQLDWGVPTGRLVVRSAIDGVAAPVRLNVLDGSGHPVVPESGMVRSDAQNVRTFFYSDGEIELTGPAGPVTISAVQGFETPQAVANATIRAGETTTVTVNLQRLWDASEDGWYSGDNHFHLNYGGPYRLDPDDIIPDLRGEGMDVAFPLLANLHNRFLQQSLWGWRHAGAPIIEFGQEVRSHFLGHLLLIGIDDLFWPWIWGPGYEIYGTDDRPNAVALRHARANGGLGGYVHPVDVQDPFTAETAASVPIGFVADAVLREVDLIEVGCLWTDEIGTAALWHSVLNLGIPLAASAGSDVMNNYYRTMAIGATRVYVKPAGTLDTAGYLQALAAGRSFVSNGPLLDFQVGGREPGEVVDATSGTVGWTLNVHSALPYDSVEIFVNGTAAQTFAGNPAAGSKRYEGALEAPSGGWVTARVVGSDTAWPAMDSYLYAESSPVWFGAVGSTEPAARRLAAQKLLMVLDVAEKEMRSGYGTAPIPELLAHFARARSRLQAIAAD